MRRLTLLVTLVFALPLAAQTDLGVHVARAQAGSTTAEDVTLSFDRGRGYGVSLDHRWGEHASIELAATWLRFDGSARLDPTASADLGTLKLLPISATARWHFAPRGERIDPYVGAGAAYVKASDLTGGDLEALGIGPVPIESKRCWVANAGVAFNVRTFTVVIDGKYLDYRPQSGPPDEQVRLDLKPVVISAGLRFRL